MIILSPRLHQDRFVLAFLLHEIFGQELKTLRIERYEGCLSLLKLQHLLVQGRRFDEVVLRRSLCVFVLGYTAPSAQRSVDAVQSLDILEDPAQSLLTVLTDDQLLGDDGRRGSLVVEDGLTDELDYALPHGHLAKLGTQIEFRSLHLLRSERLHLI